MTIAITPQDPGVPLAIWPVAQTTAQHRRAGRDLPGCTTHPGKMLPELARRIVTDYSTPGQLSSSRSPASARRSSRRSARPEAATCADCDGS